MKCEAIYRLREVFPVIKMCEALRIKPNTYYRWIKQEEARRSKRISEQILIYRIQPVQKRAGIYEETYAGTKNIDGEIKDGQYLILGDSREKATDSRIFGLIPGKSIKGKVFTIIRRRPL